MEFNVRQFGAVGDGRAKDTSAIQAAIDRCHASGGGRVVFSAGRYLSGTVFLKDNVELHLVAGATLLGSPDREDYDECAAFPESIGNVMEKSSGAHLIVGYRVTNVAITGQGCIDGNAEGFFFPLSPDERNPCYARRRFYREVDTWRPGQMLWFCRCRRVAIRDVALTNPPYWTLLLLGCDGVQVRGVTCENPSESRNGDGIDIDCSRNVTVSDCILRTGDDCITLRGNVRLLGDAPQACENVTVTNCVCSTPTCAIRVGVGDGTIRRCSFSNLIVHDARTGICITSCYRQSPTCRHGVHIEQIFFSNFTMDCILPIVMTVGPEAQEGAVIQDIGFDSFRITAFGGSQVIGRPGMPIRRVRLSNFEWCLRGGTDNLEYRDRKPEVFPVDGFKAYDGQPGLPAALYGVELEDGRFEHIRLRWDAPSPVWRDGFYFEDSRRLEFHEVDPAPPRPGKGQGIRLENVAEVSGVSTESGHGSGSPVLTQNGQVFHREAHEEHEGE